MSRPTAPAHFTLIDDVEKYEKEIVEGLLAVPEGRTVRIVINSGGGSVYSGLGIGTVLKMRRFQSEAVVLADCSSAALLVFAACKVRRVAPHASFLFHPMRWTSEEQARLSGAKSWLSEFQRVSSACEDWLVENLPMPRRLLRQWVREERYVRADELFDMGLAEPLSLEDQKVIPIGPARRARIRTAAAAKTVRLRKAG